jgi:hypothetical protein
VKQFYRWGGAAFMLGNVLFLLNKVNEMSRLFFARPMPDVISGQDPLLILIGQAALIFGYVAYYRFYSAQVGRFTRLALWLFSAGGIVLAIGHVSFMSSLAKYLPHALASYAESVFVLVLLGMLLLLIGLIWFGVLNIRRPIMARWQWLPLATGLMGFIGFFLFSGEEITATFLLFRTLFALGLIGLGFELWLEKPVELNPVAKEYPAGEVETG